MKFIASLAFAVVVLSHAQTLNPSEPKPLGHTVFSSPKGLSAVKDAIAAAKDTIAAKPANAKRISTAAAAKVLPKAHTANPFGLSTSDPKIAAAKADPKIAAKIAAKAAKVKIVAPTLKVSTDVQSAINKLNPFGLSKSAPKIAAAKADPNIAAKIAAKAAKVEIVAPTLKVSTDVQSAINKLKSKKLGR